MISFYYTTKDRFSRYGIYHFIEKFGIPVEINKPSQSGIVITYGVQGPGDFIISVDENEIKNNLCGKIQTNDENIPLCEIPFNTGSADEVIGHFENNDTRYPCVTRTDHGYSIGIDIFKETGWLLSGHLDTVRSSLDTTTKKEVALNPTVDLLQNILFNAILAGCSAQNIPLVRKSYWPDGKKFAVCLTHDVDEIKKTYQWISRPLRYLVKKDIHGFLGQIHSFIQTMKGNEPYYTYEDILCIERDLGAKSTYFILKESGNASFFSKKTWYLYGRNRSLKSPEMRELLQQLKSNGDEVAIHGSYFSYRDPLLLNDETRELEQLIHEKVIGTRQHNLNLDIPATWNHQVSAGLKYDTSLGFKDTIGFRWGTSFPFYPNTGEKSLPLLEIPLIIMDICLESSNNKESDCLHLADKVRRNHGVLTLLWHPPLFNSLEYPGARDIYIKIIQYCMENGAWIVRGIDIYEWLIRRNQYMLNYEYRTLDKTIKIIPDPGDKDQYLTLHLPYQSICDIRSGNAHIIRKDENCVFIKTHHLRDNDEIIIGLA
jgi:hypothetical protein